MAFSGWRLFVSEALELSSGTDMKNRSPRPRRLNPVLYVLVLAACVALIALLLRAGDATVGQPRTAIDTPLVAASTTEHLGAARGAENALSLLMLQMLVIIVAAHGCGRVSGALGQPAVIGELAAGLLLGRSVLGHFMPNMSSAIFPPSSLAALGLVGGIGVVLYMFTVGLAVNVADVRARAQSAVAISHASIALPFTLGVVAAFPLFAQYAPPGVTFTAFALFMGVAMSITALPVLARVLEAKGLTGTPLGTTALACAAVDDVSAWTLLAVIVALVTASDSLSTFAVILAALAVFLVVMLLAIRPLIAEWANRRRHAGAGHRLGVPLAIVFASALTTDLIGVHALFGAFVAGTIIPADEALRTELRERLENVCGVVFLPVFFAFTGLRTEIGVLNEAAGWLVCGAVIAVATIGKLVGGMVAARWTGFSWRDAFSVGVLMNTRGLMELVALNVGYELGILSTSMFTILVLMALVTTAMTGPLLDLVNARARSAPSRGPANHEYSAGAAASQ
jgi:Kef-type K+ transport system membrane component KefB